MPYINDSKDINDDDKFIIYKATGGLVHMLSGLLYTIEQSIKMDRILIIDTMNSELFNNYLLDFFCITADTLRYSENYDLIPTKYISHDSLIKLKNPSYWAQNGIYKLNNEIITINIEEKKKENIIIFAGTSGRYPSNNILKVNKNIMTKLKETNIPKEQFISIHFRNTDIHNDIQTFANLINKTAMMNNITLIYLATDDHSAYDIFKNKLNDNLNLIQYIVPCNYNGKGIHFGNPDKKTVIYNALLDMYVILHSTFFIPSKNSGFSKYLINMINKKNNIFEIDSDTIII